jgi:hypothetical protein
MNSKDTPENTLVPENTLAPENTLQSGDIPIRSETELKNAINNVAGPTNIALNNDITLTESLIIPDGKDITLTSAGDKHFFKLFGVNGADVYSNGVLYADVGNTIVIESGGVLRLDGIIITHESGQVGRGVNVADGGTFIMYSGEISGNSANLFLPVVGDFCSTGGGVFNRGVFEFHGGKISNNNAPDGFGGGVTNYGSFVMSGGEITDNTAGLYGGGVCNMMSGNFVMSGGEVSNNKVSSAEQGFGGGISNSATFVMSGGKISNNKASNGGGVYVATGNMHADGTCDGSFSMSGGEISGNTAQCGGGVCYFMDTFKKVGGVISGNTAIEGKDVYNKRDNNW